MPLFLDPTQGNQDNKVGRAGAYDAGEQEGALLSRTDPQTVENTLKSGTI